MHEIYPGGEKRKFKRVKLKFTISVIYRKDEPLDVRIRDGEKEYEAAMLDISVEGMSVLTDVNIAVATILWIKFTLTHIEKQCVDFFGTIEIKGEVRNNIIAGPGRYRLGICFLNITERDRRQITDFMSALEKEG